MIIGCRVEHLVVSVRSKWGLAKFIYDMPLFDC